MRNLEIKIDNKKAAREFQIIRAGKENGYKTNSAWNEIILKFQWKEFYKKEIELWNKNDIYKGLPLQSWIYNNRLKYINKGAEELTDREILRAFKIAAVHIGNSFHSPFYIQQFIKDYNIKSVYDPCGGWGHRLLGAWNIDYIYNDINTVTYNNCIEMYNYLQKLDNRILKTGSKYFYNKDSSNFTPSEQYEAVFTCPPYFNTERYSIQGAENLKYDQFLNWWKETIIHSLKPDCKYFCYIINNRYKNDMNDTLLKLGLKLEKEIILGNNNLNHFQRIVNNSFKGEVLNLFIKTKGKGDITCF